MRQSARMSKITNDGLTRSGTGCFLYSCTHVATLGVKWLIYLKAGSDTDRVSVAVGWYRARRRWWAERPRLAVSVPHSGNRHRRRPTTSKRCAARLATTSWRRRTHRTADWHRGRRHNAAGTSPSHVHLCMKGSSTTDKLSHKYRKI